jgi:dTDP-4-amino-4,6-dideoxygalactose transaminase
LKYDRRIVPVPRARTDDLMQVVLLHLRLQYASIGEDIVSPVTRVCDSQAFIMGPDVERLAFEVAARAIVPVHLDGLCPASDVLALSIHPELTREQQPYVAAGIAERPS